MQKHLNLPTRTNQEALLLLVGNLNSFFKSIRKVASSGLLIAIHLKTHSLFKTAVAIRPKTHAECKYITFIPRVLILPEI